MIHVLALLFVVLTMNAPAFAETPALSSDIAKIEHYLRNLDTVQARFLQTAPNGHQLVGTFYMDRPGKLRFEYDDPIEDFIVADGLFIYFYDAQLGEQTNAPIGFTLADFLLRKDLRLSGDVDIQQVLRNDGILQIKLAQTSDPGSGSITLGFTENPFQLKKWRVIDPQGLITEIEFFHFKTGMDLKRSLFVYTDPKRFQGEPVYND